MRTERSFRADDTWKQTVRQTNFARLWRGGAQSSRDSTELKGCDGIRLSNIS